MSWIRRLGSGAPATVTRLFLLCLILAPVGAAQDDGAPLEAYRPATFRDAKGVKLKYRLFIPANLESGSKYPLVLYLHSITAVGGDNRQQVTGSVELGARVWAAPSFQSVHPCFVVVPQCPFGSLWANPLTRKPSRHLRAVRALVDELARQYPLDTDRLYVTGHSMGGYGTWALAAAYPDCFAAAVPIAGGGSTRQAAALSQMPIWAFHGGMDPLVLPHESRRMINAIRKVGGNPLYTEFPLTLHRAWKLAYLNPALAIWMFSQNLAGRAAVEH